MPLIVPELHSFFGLSSLDVFAYLTQGVAAVFRCFVFSRPELFVDHSLTRSGLMLLCLTRFGTLTGYRAPTPPNHPTLASAVEVRECEEYIGKALFCFPKWLGLRAVFRPFSWESFH